MNYLVHYVQDVICHLKHDCSGFAGEVSVGELCRLGSSMVTVIPVL